MLKLLFKNKTLISMSYIDKNVNFYLKNRLFQIHTSINK